MSKIWQHGDIPTHTEMQGYSNDLNTLYTATPVYNSCPAILRMATVETVSGQTYRQLGYQFRIIHVSRYLHYQGSGKLVDVAVSSLETGLAETGSGYGVVDLDTVQWLVYGQWYEVQGVDFCMEDEEP